MKDFMPISFDAVQCRKELDRLQALLASKGDLSERNDLQPLFKECPQLVAFIGTAFPHIGPANRLAYEFQIFGDYAADIVIGNYERKSYCAIELEDARPNSIFNRLEGRATPEWGRRFEHGFGQLVDWFFSFDDYKNAAGFTKNFGYGHIEVFWHTAHRPIDSSIGTRSHPIAVAVGSGGREHAPSLLSNLRRAVQRSQ